MVSDEERKHKKAKRLKRPVGLWRMPDLVEGNLHLGGQAAALWRSSAKATPCIFLEGVTGDATGRADSTRTCTFADGRLLGTQANHTIYWLMILG